MYLAYLLTLTRSSAVAVIADRTAKDVGIKPLSRIAAQCDSTAVRFYERTQTQFMQAWRAKCTMTIFVSCQQ